MNLSSRGLGDSGPVRSDWKSSRDLVNSSGDTNAKPENRDRQAGSWCQRVCQSMKAATRREDIVPGGSGKS